MSMVLIVGAVIGLLFALGVGFAIFSQFGGKFGIIGTSASGLIGFILGLVTSLYQFYGAAALGGLGIVGYGLIGSIFLLLIALIVNGVDDILAKRTFNPYGK